MREPDRPYNPAPFKLEGVELEPHIKAVIEQLAELNHDAWAWNRLREGWRLGPERDDAGRRHPNLVPYDQLREDEKDYDRNAVESTIRSLAGLGYRILPPDHMPAEDSQAEAVVEAMRSFIKSADVRTLAKFWQDHEPKSLGDSADVYSSLGSRFVKSGEPLLAYEVAAEALSLWPDHERLQHLKGLSLARSGALESANALAERLSAGVRDRQVMEDALGLLARTHKDLALDAGSDADRRAHMLRAHEAYRAGFDRSGGYYTAINAASTAHLLGDGKAASELATKARDLAAQELKRAEESGRPAYWELATLGEAALLLGEAAEAERFYGSAVKAAGSQYSDVVSMHRQLRLITKAAGEPVWAAKMFRVPTVVVFAGDGAAVEPGSGSLAGILRDKHAGFGYSSATTRPDLVFLETMAAVGGKTHVVLPYPRAIVAANFQSSHDHTLAHRFDAALEAASEVTTASDGWFADTDLVSEYTDLVLLGSAKIQSTVLETKLIPIAAAGDSRTAGRWRERGYEVDLIQ